MKKHHYMSLNLALWRFEGGPAFKLDLKTGSLFKLRRVQGRTFKL